MTNLIVYNLEKLGTPKRSKALPERIIEGDPDYNSWEIDSIHGCVRSGIWEATPGVTKSVKGEVWEYCTILSGIVELTEDGGKHHLLKAGDTFIMRPGFVGTWKTIETVRKLWVVATPPAK